MLRIAVLVSGGGTNFQAIIDAIDKGDIKNAEIVGLISSSHKAYALERAKKHGIKASVVSMADYKDAEERNEALIDEVRRLSPDLIVLAGFLTIVPEKLVSLYPDRIINIHPSLIPSFCGTGFYGLKVHEKAIERGVKVTGATVHFVDTGTDTGPIILQKAVNVEPDDTPELLQKRVMEQAEWKILPEVIDAIANGRLIKSAKGRYHITVKEEE